MKRLFFLLFNPVTGQLLAGILDIPVTYTEPPVFGEVSTSEPLIEDYEMEAFHNGENDNPRDWVSMV